MPTKNHVSNQSKFINIPKAFRKFFNINCGTLPLICSNTYVFKVSKEATKTDIKNSIEDVFGVTVNSVRVLNTKFKNKRTRFGKYKTSTYKKAYVTLAEGKEINMENPFK